MFEAIYEAAIKLGLDDFAIVQIFALSGVCGFLVSQVMDGWFGPIFSYMGLVTASVATNVFCRKMGLVLTQNKQLDGIIYTSAAIIAGAIVVVLVLLLVSVARNRVGVTAQKLRAQSDAAA